MSTTIHSPVKDYTGRTIIGPISLNFTDGEAKYDGELSEGVKNYLTANGYGVNGKAGDPAETPEPADPRETGRQQVGTPLRDAAVDPKPTDFLPPTNAGQANPHGSQVVSPELHASQGVRPVTPGDVNTEDPEAQESKETSHTEKVQESGTELEKPPGNAIREAWEAYAIAQGKTTDELDGLGRDAIRDMFKDDTTEQ
jgi:hypothetical protein